MSNDTEHSEMFHLTTIASCFELNEIEEALFTLTDSLGHVTEEEDTYFNVFRGELRLRVAKPNQKIFGELITSKRCSTSVDGVFCVKDSIAPVQEVESLQHTLKSALSVLGSMHIRRRLYAKDNIYIHLDEIESIGTYLQIDINLPSSTVMDSDIQLMKSIQNALGIHGSHLVPYSYLDLYRKQKSSDSGVDEESNQSDF